MYLFGAWVTKSKLYSEPDEEAIFDADKEFRNSNLSEWKYSVALWQGIG